MKLDIVVKIKKLVLMIKRKKLDILVKSRKGNYIIKINYQVFNPSFLILFYR